MAFDRAEVHPGDPEAVTRDADVAGQALVPGREQRLERTARTGGDLPLVGLDEVARFTLQSTQPETLDGEPLVAWWSPDSLETRRVERGWAGTARQAATKGDTMRSTTELWTYGTDLQADQADIVGYDVDATDGDIGKIDK